jgi:hypothetical protein
MATTPTSNSPASKQAPVALAPFRAGTQPTLVSDGYSNSTALTTSTTVLPNYTPSPNNYLRGLYIQSVCTAVNTSSDTVAFNGDGPFIAYSTIVLADANQKPIVGPISGYELMIVNKFGGYQHLSDPRASAVYSVTTGSGTSGGSWTFVLYVPVEVNLRSFGALQNQSSDSTLSLQLTLNTESAVYSVSPATSATVVTTIYESGWWVGDVAGTSATPPASGTTQYWTLGSYSSLNGSVQAQLQQGLGYPIRNMTFLNYDVSNSTRATGNTDFPTTTQLLYRGTSYFNISKTLWQDMMSRAYGLTSATADTANGLENGVYVIPWFMQDVQAKPGNELALGYLNTNQGDSHQFIATFNGNSNLYFLCNYVAVVGGYSAIQGKV